jgi:hypothetical protein
VKDAWAATTEDEFTSVTTMLTPILMADFSSFAFLGFDVVGGESGECFPVVAEETFSVDGESVDHNCSFYACAFGEIFPFYHQLQFADGETIGDFSICA